MTKTQYQELVQEMKKHREKKHYSKKDVERILEAQKTGKWSEVFGSKLYKDYGGEYCSLLEVINYMNL